MKTKSARSAIVLAGLILIGGGAWGWREHNVAREANASRALVARNTAVLASQQRVIDARLTRATVEAEELNKTLAQFSAAAKAREKLVAPPSAKTSDGVDVNGRWVRALRSDPTIQALQVARSRWRLETQFAPLCRNLGLTPAQQEKFYDNLMAWETKIADTQAAADAQDIADTDGTVAHLVAQISRECEAAQRELLGEEDYRRWREFAATSIVREMVGGLAKVCTAVGVPLSVQQAEALVPLIRGGTLPPRENQTANIKSLDWTRMDAAVRGVLTDEQFALFKTTEPSMRSAVTRFSTPLHELIDRAREADAAAAGSPRPGG
jgi:hypothetical protein